MSFANIIDQMQHRKNYLVEYTAGRIEMHSFREVHHDVMELARHLEQKFDVRQQVCGVIGDISYRHVILDLALNYCGATTFTLPESFVDESAESLINDYQLNYLFVDKAAAHHIPAEGAVTFDDLFARKINVKEVPRDHQLKLEMPFAIALSSGTTGAPRPILYSEAGVLNMLGRFQQHLQITTGDLFFIFLPLSSFQQKAIIYGCLQYDVAIALCNPKHVMVGLQKLNPTILLAPPLFYENVYKYMAKNPNTTMLQRGVLGALRIFGAPPSLKKLVLKKLHQSFGGKIRMLITGMAPIDATVVKFFHQLGLPLLQAYGTNEVGPIASNSLTANRIGSVGKPLKGVNVQITPEGEIAVAASPPLSLGLVNVDGKIEMINERKYMTGDLGSMDENGYLYLTGRKKNVLVSANGAKVAPEEIENQVRMMGKVQHCVVLSAMDGLQIFVEPIGELTDLDRQTITSDIVSLPKLRKNALRVTKVHFRKSNYLKTNGYITRNLKIVRDGLWRQIQAEESENGSRITQH